MKIVGDIVLEERPDYGRDVWVYTSPDFKVLLKPERGSQGSYLLHICITRGSNGSPVEKVKSFHASAIRAAFRRAVERIQRDYDETTKVLGQINPQLSKKKERGPTLWDHLDRD